MTPSGQEIVARYAEQAKPVAIRAFQRRPRVILGRDALATDRSNAILITSSTPGGKYNDSFSLDKWQKRRKTPSQLNSEIWTHYLDNCRV